MNRRALVSLGVSIVGWAEDGLALAGTITSATITLGRPCSRQTHILVRDPAAVRRRRIWRCAVLRGLLTTARKIKPGDYDSRYDAKVTASG